MSLFGLLLTSCKLSASTTSVASGSTAQIPAAWTITLFDRSELGFYSFTCGLLVILSVKKERLFPLPEPLAFPPHHSWFHNPFSVMYFADWSSLSHSFYCNHSIPLIILALFSATFPFLLHPFLAGKTRRAKNIQDVYLRQHELAQWHRWWNYICHFLLYCLPSNS